MKAGLSKFSVANMSGNLFFQADPKPIEIHKKIFPLTSLDFGLDPNSQVLSRPQNMK